MPQLLTTITFALHILGGAVALAAGTSALCVRKGGRLHRIVGDVFAVALLVMAIFAAILGAILPGQVINVFIAGFVLYLVGTAWVTARRRSERANIPEKVGLAVSLALFAPFALLIFQIVTGVILIKSAFTIRGPILIALCVFTAILAIAVVGDLKVVLGGGISGTPRIARHLWRMCFALAMVFGSAFTNGFARLLPGPFHVPPAFFFPQLVVLAALPFWLVRIRFPGWAGRGATDPAIAREGRPIGGAGARLDAP